MGYMHIDNLYKNQEILMFKECYAMEKIHGTSVHLSFNKINNDPYPNSYPEDHEFVKWELKYFSGGENHDKFKEVFNETELLDKFKELDIEKMVIFGEAYGGKQQGMSHTYGKELKFIAFDVKIGESWLSVPDAESIVNDLGLEFVDYKKVSTDLGDLDYERDRPSVQAKRNGIEEDKMREGIVLRPLIELRKNNGARIICKHKGEKFQETKTKRKVVDPEKLKVLSEAKDIAEEWVTPMRLSHLLGKIENPDITMMGDFIKSMIEDVQREAEGEIVWSKEVGKAIGKRTASLVKQHFNDKLRANV